MGEDSIARAARIATAIVVVVKVDRGELGLEAARGGEGRLADDSPDGGDEGNGGGDDLFEVGGSKGQRRRTLEAPEWRDER